MLDSSAAQAPLGSTDTVHVLDTAAATIITLAAVFDAGQGPGI